MGTEETAAEGEGGGPVPRLILASASPRRLALLSQIGLAPVEVRATEIDETPGKGELPRDLARRLARHKAQSARHQSDADPPAFLVAADTVVSVGRRILPKAETEEEARRCLILLSGRAHRVHTGVCLLTPTGRLRERLVETRVKFKRLSESDVSAYVASAEWRGKAGGYAIQGLAGAFVLGIVGSYSSVVGLPLYETASLLGGEGYPIRRGWAAGA
jgi:septum formation protein